MNTRNEKKSAFLGCTEEEFFKVADHIKSIFFEIDPTQPIGDQFKAKIVDFYQDKPNFSLAMYLFGETMAKLELGAEIGEELDTLASALYESLREKIKKEVDETDYLLDMFKNKKVARC